MIGLQGSRGRWRLALVCLALSLLTAMASIVACTATPRREMRVTATAYNSLPDQTSGDPSLAAWGDRLAPGMKVIAVSRDLISLGLTHRVPVRIEGLPGEYLVLDKLNKRWKARIDIYMGIDERAALQWGRQRVNISWPTLEPGQ